MKNVFSLSFLCLFAASLFAQPTIEWQKSFGGSKDDTGSLIPTTDGGYFIAGSTSSTDGDVTFNHGKEDAWAIKLDATGAIQWQKTYGGSKDDRINFQAQTRDGGFIMAGSSESSDGDLAGNPMDKQAAWIIKIDSLGSIQWQKTFYNGGYFGAACVRQTSDDGYIFCASIGAPDSVTVLVKLDAAGEVQWQKKEFTYTLSLHTLRQTADGGYIVGGDKNYLIGTYSDLCVIRYDAQGNKLWERIVGGEKFETAYSILELPQGGFLVAGYTESQGGDISNNYGIGDCWLIKLSADGNVIWDKNYGGSYDDGAIGLTQTSDGGFLMTAYTYSIDYDVLLHYFGDSDIWLVKLNQEGEIQWQITLGGYNYDGASETYQTSDGGFILAGYTRSVDENVEFNHGLGDIWVVKLSAVVAAHEPFAAEALSLSPNPAHDVVLLQTPAGTEVVRVDISDVAGQTVLSQNMSGNNQVNISGLPPGMYLVKAKSTSGELFANRLIKQ